jgi:hypothetical protein
MNKFVKPRMTKAFADAYPAYSIRIGDMNYSIVKNRIGFDSVVLRAADGTFSSKLSLFSIGGIAWIHFLWSGTLGPKNFVNADLDVQGIELNLPRSHYELHCKRLRVSVPLSNMVAESLELQPMAGDEEFFSGSTFRRTRLILTASRCSIKGLACLDLLQGKMYRANSIQVYDAFLDILVNKDKPDSRDTSGPLMPNEILSSVKKTLQIDKLSIMNGRLKYSERFVFGSKPGFITFDSMKVLAEGIANHAVRDSVLVIQAQGKFMNAGTMKVIMIIPVASPEFSFHYSGSLSGMDLSPINSFLEISDQMRIKTGVLQEATFDVDVVSGKASGTLRGVYTDLTLAAIDKNTGSEKGFSNGFVSFIANHFKIRRTNVPDKSGSIKIGEVKYLRVRDDPFIQFEWFALRTAVQNIVGF